MTFDEFRDLMEEEPGGENHGRRRSPVGSWHDLDGLEADLVGHAAQYGFHVDPVSVDPLMHKKLEHGKESTYNNYQCKCEPCRLAASAARKRRRLSNSKE